LPHEESKISESQFTDEEQSYSAVRRREAVKTHDFHQLCRSPASLARQTRGRIVGLPRAFFVSHCRGLQLLAAASCPAPGRPGRFLATDERVLQIAARHLAAAMSNIRLQRKSLQQITVQKLLEVLLARRSSGDTKYLADADILWKTRHTNIA